MQFKLGIGKVVFPDIRITVGSSGGVGGKAVVVVYQYTRMKVPKVPKYL